MGSRIGITKIAAKRIGITYDEYLSQTKSGLKWCHRCKRWKERERFGIDRSRGDGHHAICQDCRHVKIPKQRKNPTGVTPREQSKASSAISYMIRKGYMKPARKFNCKDCGKQADVYHHHRGYSPDAWFKFVPLCHACHQNRHWNGEPK